jgi:hypothetical protein
VETLDSGLIRMRPLAGLVGREAPEDDDERMSPSVARRLALVARQRELTAALGTCVLGTTMLLRSDGPALGPAKGRDGRTFRWSIWAPAKRLLVDVFQRALPPAEELEDRRAFADAHGLLYAVVEPGQRLSLDRLREWMAAARAAEAV